MLMTTILDQVINGVPFMLGYIVLMLLFFKLKFTYIAFALCVTVTYKKLFNG